MGSRQIAQETFDDAVQENITEFEMEPEEAVREAVQQFEAQGVDLSNIVKAVRPVSENGQRQKHQILLVGAQAAALSLRELCALCRVGSVWLRRGGLCSRARTGGNGLRVCQGRLRGGFPMGRLPRELWGAHPRGCPPVADVALGTRWGSVPLSPSCVRPGCGHLQSRNELVRASPAGAAIARHGGSAELVGTAASALRVMTFDDDIRVPFGHAHDHAKMIVLENDGLRVLIEAAKAFTDNSGVLSELCATLSRLSVRNEFCQEIVDLGGLNFMVTLLADCMEHPDVVKQVLGAIRAVAGNDDVKDAIVDAGATELIVLAISQHLGNPQICEQGCAALGVLALRKPDNCGVIVEGGGAAAALRAMKAHPREVAVQ
ncbi:ARMC6 protein, partial [Motacilla alba]|nr:ARMC6 protein [Motacilla alba]